MAGRQSSPMIIINASEVASVIGQHPHKSREETMLKVWERTDPRTFCIANALQNKTEVTRIVNLSQESAKDESTKEEFSRLLFEDWDKNDGTFIQVLKEIFPEERLPKSFLYSLRWKILNAMKVHTIPDFREKKLLKEAKVEEVLIEEVKNLSENEVKPISKSVEEICEKTGIKNEEVKKAVESTLTKDRGTKLESKTVEVFGQEKGIKVKKAPQETISKVMEYEGVIWLLRGRADALLEDKVIEVKNRKSRFMQPFYDLIQLQTYLYLYEKQEGILLERLNKQNRETEVKFEESFWNDEVQPALKDFVSELQIVVERNLSLLKDNECTIEIATMPSSPCKRPNDKPLELLIKEKIARIDETVEPDRVVVKEDSESLDNFEDQKGENMDEKNS